MSPREYFLNLLRENLEFAFTTFHLLVSLIHYFTPFILIGNIEP